jgi:hypothetical protein
VFALEKSISFVIKFPPPTASVLILPFWALGIVVVDIIVKVTPPLIFNFALLPEAAPTVIFEAVASSVTVTVVPAAIVTSSPDTGTGPPPQVAVEFQFPDTEEVMVAAKVDAGKNKQIITKNRVVLKEVIPSKRGVFVNR